jgi:hypothetical protein
MSWSNVLAALPPRRRVHISNAREVMSLRVSLFRLTRRPAAVEACACCGVLAPRELLLDVYGDRMHVECIALA